MLESYLITSLAVEQYPTNFDDLCRILCHINAMFVAGGRYVDDNIAVELGNRRSCGGHGDLGSLSKWETRGEFFMIELCEWTWSDSVGRVDGQMRLVPGVVHVSIRKGKSEDDCWNEGD